MGKNICIVIFGVIAIILASNCDADDLLRDDVERIINGLLNGEIATVGAYVEFASAEDAKKAMSKDKMLIGSRDVELFPSTPDEFRRVASRSW